MGRRGDRPGPYALDDEEGDGTVVARNPVVDAQLAKLSTDGRVRAAALVAETFSLDPVAVLEERDPLKRLLRIAAHNHVVDAHEKAAKRSK